MSIKLEIEKVAVRLHRKKQVLGIKRRCNIRGEEVAIPRPGKNSIQAYLYYPMRNEASLPILINVHGGAWVGGDALVMDTQSGKLADALDCLVVNLNYRKADMEPLPYCQEEARDIAEYFISHAVDYCADCSKVALIGYSAGAQICASAAQMLYDEGYRISCQILCYPFVDFTCDGGTQKQILDGLATLGEYEKLFFKEISKYDPRVSPALRTNLSGLAPAIIIEAGKDILNVQAEQYHKLLTAAGVNSELLVYPAAYHGFMEVNYPETTQKQEARSPEQAEIMRQCEADIISRLKTIWE